MGMNGCIKENIFSKCQLQFIPPLPLLRKLCNLIAFVYGCTTKKQRKAHISDTVLKTKTKHSIQASYALEFYTEDIHTIFYSIFQTALILYFVRFCAYYMLSAVIATIITTKTHTSFHYFQVKAMIVVANTAQHARRFYLSHSTSRHYINSFHKMTRLKLHLAQGHMICR